MAAVCELVTTKQAIQITDSVAINASKSSAGWGEGEQDVDGVGSPKEALNFRGEEHSIAEDPKLFLTAVCVCLTVGLSVYNNRNMHEIISQFAGKYSL